MHHKGSVSPEYSFFKLNRTQVNLNNGNSAERLVMLVLAFKASFGEILSISWIFGG